MPGGSRPARSRGISPSYTGRRCHRRSSRPLRTRCWRTCAPGRPGRSPRCTPSSILMRCLSNLARRGRCRPKRCTSRWVSPWTARKNSWGLWLSESEGAKFWLAVFTELKNRGVQDCFMACVDGLQGLPEAIEAVFPKTQVQLCIVHKVRNSLKYVPWKERRAVAADLRAIYGATTLAAAEQALERFADRWDTKYPAISPSWLADWDRLTVFFDYPPAIRRAVYTTNAIESLNYSLRKVLKGRSAFPNDESILKVLYMGLQHVAKKWTQPIPEWKAALNQFVMLFGERVQV